MGRPIGLLRQKYLYFYSHEAKAIIEEYNEHKGKNYKKICAEQGNKIQFEDLDFNPSDRYKKYTKKMLIACIVTFVSFFIGLIPVGLIGIFVIFGFFIFMPKDLKEEANVYNKRQEKLEEKFNDNIGEIAPRLYDNEYSLKELLMQKFLAIFGDFTWQKYKSLFRIDDLVILPSNLSFDVDDSITGTYDDVKVKMSEVYSGYKAMINSGKKYSKAMRIWGILFVITFVSAPFSLFFKFMDIFVKVMFCLCFILLLVISLIEILGPISLFLNSKYARGLVVEFDMPKSFNGEIVLFENNISRNIINYKLLKNFQKTELEDVEFNSKYSIYTTNQIEARYVLTTSFIERLKNIKLKFNASSVRLQFKNNKLILFISTHKDLFKMGESNRDTDMMTFNILFEEIYSILLLIDELKLNVKTGL